MKHILMVLTLAALSFPALAADVKPDVTIKVNGMVCDTCAQSVMKIFKKEDSVNDVSIDLDKGEVAVDVKDGMTLSDETINKLIDYSGYEVTGIVR